jgi:rSAM/selenodomain-associated transferase 1
MKRHLILYAKRPIPRQCKTRLGRSLGWEAAAGVYARLLHSLLADVAATPLPETTLELAVASPDDCAYFRKAYPEFLVRTQTSGDLGNRMAHSFHRAFREGAAAVVLAGSDIPGLTGHLIGEAFASLEGSKAGIPGVIGPAADGGYYLLGMGTPGADLFSDIAWSRATVLAQTVTRARALRVELACLPTLADLDVIVDYERWAEKRRSGADRTIGPV